MFVYGASELVGIDDFSPACDLLGSIYTLPTSVITGVTFPPFFFLNIKFWGVTELEKNLILRLKINGSIICDG